MMPLATRSRACTLMGPKHTTASRPWSRQRHGRNCSNVSQTPICYHYCPAHTIAAVMIRASYDELARAGESPESSIQLQAGGYLASLGVYHDLHCLVRESISPSVGGIVLLMGRIASNPVFPLRGPFLPQHDGRAAGGRRKTCR
jgi:hypothetical protein